MTRPERALRSAAIRLLPVEREVGADIVDTAVEISTGQPPCRRAKEYGSLVGLAVRLRGVRAVGDDRSAMTRTGLAIGSAWVALAMSGSMLAAEPATSRGTALAAAFAALAAVTTRPTARVPLLAVSAALWSLTATEPAQMPVFAGYVLAATLCLFTPGRPRRRWTPSIAAAAVLLGAASAANAVAAGPNLVSPTTIMLACAVGPLVPLAVGWFDPRYAVAATSIWLWRFAGADLGELATSIARLGSDLTVELFLVRWTAMAAGVIAGVTMWRASLRRLAL